jgi:transcriptional regulator with XRE-family HTH domain
VNTLKNKKIGELKDRESRQFFYEEHIETGLPIQIRELRKKQKLTQKELSELTGLDQSNISDWENPNYEYTPQISTLKRLANGFDVPLIVRFGSWEELLDWDSNLSSEKIAPESFDKVLESLEEKKNVSFNQLLTNKQSATPAQYDILPQNNQGIVKMEEFKKAKATKAGNLLSENSQNVAEAA